MNCPQPTKPPQKQSTLFKAVLLVLGVVGLFAVGLYLPQQYSLAQSATCNTIDECEQEINKITDFLNQHRDATENLEIEVSNLEDRIANARAGIAAAQAESEQVAEEIEAREDDLAYQYNVLSKRIAVQYKRMRIFSPLMLIFSSSDAKELTKDLAYRNSAKAQDSQLIQALGTDIAQLQQDKKELEENQIALANLEAQLDEQAEFLRGEIAEAQEFHEDLEGQIAELTARQQEIIAARSGSFTVNLSGNYGSGGGSRSEFLASAPSGHFGVFSFGGYSHRNGMSQYGALGRAKNGQSAEDILKYYYQGVDIEEVDTNQTIVVNGTNTYDQTFNNESYQLEEYLKHIYEVPSDWEKEVLKAQAIAARTFAYGKSTICPGQLCQEFKREENADAWKQAVKETKGKIMTGGSGNSQYASTHGGWINGTGWDTTDNSGGDNFLDKSYEHLAGSPWVYSAWYVDIFNEWGGGTCGQSDPWLSPEEMADIVNAHLVLTQGSSSETDRIEPVTTSCWDGDPYSHAELRDVASKYGGISSATSKSVNLGNGRTNSVTINGVSMTGDEFCNAFNLRAPGYLRIPQWSGNECNGAFFNIEHK